MATCTHLEDFQSLHTYSDDSGRYDYTVTTHEDMSRTYRVEHAGRASVAVMNPVIDGTVGVTIRDFIMVDEKLAIGDGVAMYGGVVYRLDWWTVPTL